MKHLILYDGVCGLCNRLNRFVLARDRETLFAFASLQSGLARRILSRFGQEPGDLNTFYVVANFDSPQEKLHERASAALFVLNALPRYRLVARISSIIPINLLNCGYDLIARSRYRIFGQYGTCPLPKAEERNRFLEI